MAHSCSFTLNGTLLRFRTSPQSKELLGLFFHRFYQHADQETLRQLYISIVLSLESAHTNNGDKGYDELLNMTYLSSLADRMLYLKLCSLYKIVHNLSSLPAKTVLPKVARLYTSTHFTDIRPLDTLIVFLTLFPLVVSHWNSLPVDIVSAPFPSTFINMHLNIVISYVH